MGENVRHGQGFGRINSLPSLKTGEFIRGAIAACIWFLMLFVPATFMLLASPLVIEIILELQGGTSRPPIVGWQFHQLPALLLIALGFGFPITGCVLLLTGMPAYLFARLVLLMPRKGVQLIAWSAMGLVIGAGTSYAVIALTFGFSHIRPSLVTSVLLTYAVTAAIALPLGWKHVTKRALTIQKPARNL